jgi:DNA primase small subunit
LKKKSKDKNFIERIKLSYCYPRIDIKVTEGFNHLLKAPFSVHPKTGKICIPFDSDQVDEFNLDKVPTILSIRANPAELDYPIEILRSMINHE